MRQINRNLIIICFHANNTELIQDQKQVFVSIINAIVDHVSKLARKKMQLPEKS